MQCNAKVIEHSVNNAGVELITLQLRYPRFVHAEFMTHRVFSRNASSSRAIPVAKMIEQVRGNPAMPVHWGKNQPGMQAREELTGDDLRQAQEVWNTAAILAATQAGLMNRIGVHKQVANRLLEPFQYISVVVTATEWSNFFELRDHEDADPTIAQLAGVMDAAIKASKPELRSLHNEDLAVMTSQQWHLPYVSDQERFDYFTKPEVLAKISSARCARVSYLTHDGQSPSIEKDLELYERLVGSVPLHASPTEHPCLVTETAHWFKNFRGWIQHRFQVEDAILQSKE